MSEWVQAVANPAEPDVLSRVRLFAILGTWMEADVVGDSVRNALTQGCERVYLVDNASSDGTVEIAVGQGAILAHSFSTEHYDENLRLHFMNKVVAEVSSSETDENIWWLFLDADEFSHGPWGMSLLEYLKTLDRRFRIVGSQYFNHFPHTKPQYVSGRHPLEFQPLCEELVFPMCPSGHRKHPLQRYDRNGARSCGSRIPSSQMREPLFEPLQPVVLHHFPFREEEVTRNRLALLWAEKENGLSRAVASDDATGHMLPRYRSLDAVYTQDWGRVENFMPTQPAAGVHLKNWQELVEEEHQHVRSWSSLVDAWNYNGAQKWHFGDDTTYHRGIAFLDGHGTIEDWGCGFAHARTFVHSSRYLGIDGSSPHADKIVDLCEYRSDADCIFMRHVLEHNIEWRKILAGAIASFRKRMVLIVFTPFAETTRVITTRSVAHRWPCPTSPSGKPISPSTLEIYATSRSP